MAQWFLQTFCLLTNNQNYLSPNIAPPKTHIERRQYYLYIRNDLGLHFIKLLRRPLRHSLYKKIYIGRPL